MKNRTKIAVFIMLFWVLLQIALRLIGFSSIPVFIFTIIGYLISNLTCMCLDTHNEKVGRWFDSTKFFKM